MAKSDRDPGQSDLENGALISAALCGRTTTNPTRAENLAGEGEGLIFEASFNGDVPIPPALRDVFDPLEDLSQPWTSADLEGFGDLSGFDPWLVSLMTV